MPRLRRGGAAGVPPAALASFARRRRPTEAICGQRPPSFPIREYLSSREKPSPLTKPLLGAPPALPPRKSQKSNKAPSPHAPLLPNFCTENKSRKPLLMRQKSSIIKKYGYTYISAEPRADAKTAAVTGFCRLIKAAALRSFLPFRVKKLCGKKTASVRFPPWRRKYDRCRR